MKFLLFGIDVNVPTVTRFVHSHFNHDERITIFFTC